MAIVTNQDKTHALFPTLDGILDTRDVANAVRIRPRRRSKTPLSRQLEAWRSILAQLVARWRSMTPEAQDWYRDNAPPYYKSGYNWYLSQELDAASKRGHWEDGI